MPGSQTDSLKKLALFSDGSGNRYLYGCKDNSTLEVIRFEVTNAVSLGGNIPSTSYLPGVTGHNCNGIIVADINKIVVFT